MKNKFLYILVSFLFLSCQKYQRIFLIPKDYYGIIVIFYGQKYAKEENKKSNNKITFDIRDTISIINIKDKFYDDSNLDIFLIQNNQNNFDTLKYYNTNVFFANNNKFTSKETDIAVNNRFVVSTVVTIKGIQRKIKYEIIYIGQTNKLVKTDFKRYEEKVDNYINTQLVEVLGE